MLESHVVDCRVMSIVPAAYCPNLTNRIGVIAVMLWKNVITMTQRATVNTPILKARYSLASWLRR